MGSDLGEFSTQQCWHPLSPQPPLNLRCLAQELPAEAGTQYVKLPCLVSAWCWGSRLQGYVVKGLAMPWDSHPSQLQIVTSSLSLFSHLTQRCAVT